VSCWESAKAELEAVSDGLGAARRRIGELEAELAELRGKAGG